jgi:hypothetical protein
MVWAIIRPSETKVNILLFPWVFQDSIAYYDLIPSLFTPYFWFCLTEHRKYCAIVSKSLLTTFKIFKEAYITETHAVVFYFTYHTTDDILKL